MLAGVVQALCSDGLAFKNAPIPNCCLRPPPALNTKHAGLAGERVRWESSITGYESFLAALPGDALLAAAFLSYAGPFPSEFRDELLRGTWLPAVRALGIPASDSFDFCGFLADPPTVQDWCMQGLPADAFSAANGVMVTRGRRWPLLVDPQVRTHALPTAGSVAGHTVVVRDLRVCVYRRRG